MSDEVTQHGKSRSFCPAGFDPLEQRRKLVAQLGTGSPCRAAEARVETPGLQVHRQNAQGRLQSQRYVDTAAQFATGVDIKSGKVGIGVVVQAAPYDDAD